MKVFDLRSDTVTRPSAAMRKAMAEAEVGDDVYGEDPSVNKLQEMSAAVTGKEAALFVPSGSMGNLIPIFLNCGKGNEVLCDSRAHIVQHEMASAAAIAGSLPVQIPTDRGILEVEQLESRIQPDIYYCARTRMIALENTHNACGGTFYPLATLKRIGVFARRKKMSVHMDGARLFNASIACGESVKALCTETDTVTFCISKGLGAPVGALLCGTKELIAEARRVRKLLGGGMRQAGIIAAAGVYALSNNVERLAEDHENAKTLANALACTSWAALVPEEIVTNIIYFRIPDRNAEDVVHALEQKGVLCGPAAGPDRIRFVTHLDVSRKDTAEIARILQETKV